MRRLFQKFSYLLVAVTLGAAQLAQAEGAGGSAPLKILGNHLLVPFTYKAQGFEKQSHFVVDLGSKDYVAFHKEVHKSLGSALQPGEKVRFTNDGFELEVNFAKCRNLGDGPNVCDALSAEYDVELENIDVTAVVGFDFLKEYAINFNMEDQAFSMTLSNAEHSQQVKQSSQVVVPVTIAGHNLYVPVSANGKQIGTMELQTAGYHTTIDPKLAAKLDTSKDISFGTDGKQKLSGMVAVRNKKLPKAESTAPSDRVMRTGLGLWASFDVTIDPKAGYLALNLTRNNNYHDGDVAFYKASAARDWEQLLAYLQAFPQDHNVEEAADEMFTIGMRKKAPADKMLEGLQYSLDQMKPRKKLEYMFGYCQKAHQGMPSSRFMDLTIGACEKGLEFISYSQKPSVRQQYQLILGERYLDKGDPRQGWKYYLSASFNGDPQLDGQTRMGLGRAYEAMKRYRRAYATYKRLASGMSEGQLQQTGLKVALERTAKHLDPNDALLTGDK
ncbi:hypothetical protein QP938_03850 [Porticoccaceae bacterium LTM1]|nr:hypothetical protein QP938_03850 [Porticoccaceae bacterium LTM1]